MLWNIKKITKKKLNEVLQKHEKWVEGDSKGVRADLRGIDLSYVDLSHTVLCYADLRHANLCDADLRSADLQGAILYEADLSNANLYSADLRRADLSETDLRYACLDYADLYGAILYRANLEGVSLRFTSLYCSNLSFANLDHAVLTPTNLEGANLYRANLNAIGDLVEFRTGKTLVEPLIGYKKCRNGVIVTLEIPEGAIVFSINGNKCRTNKVKVIAVDGADVGISGYNCMPYRVGDNITVSDFSCEYNTECASGIHFFTNREDAENYCV